MDERNRRRPDRDGAGYHGRMEQRSLGLLLVGLGAVLVIAGLLAWAGGLAWFGRLPGDLSWRSGGTRVYVPLTSMLVVTLVLNLVLYLLRRFG